MTRLFRHGEQGIFMTNAADSSITDNAISYTGCAAVRAHGGNATTMTEGSWSLALLPGPLSSALCTPCRLEVTACSCSAETVVPAVL